VRTSRSGQAAVLEDNAVARMQRSGIRETAPDYVSLHPGYGCGTTVGGRLSAVGCAVRTSRSGQAAVLEDNVVARM